MFRSMTPNLLTENVNRSVEFYRDVLGFEFTLGVPSGAQEMLSSYEKDRKLDHALLKRGSIWIMLHRTLGEEFPEFKAQRPGATLTFYFELEDVETFYADVRTRTEIYREMQIKWYGKKEFYIRDPDGYLLGFAGSVP